MKRLQSTQLKDNLRSFEERMDIPKLQKEHYILSDHFGPRHPIATAAARRTNSLISKLSELAVEKGQEEYFEAADRLRALSQSTDTSVTTKFVK